MNHPQASSLRINSELEFELFMHYIPANILIKDEDGTIIYANESVLKFFNIKSILGKSASDLFPLELANKMLALDKKVLKYGKYEELSEIYNADNSLRIIRTLGFKIEIKQTVQIGLVVLDITESYLDKQELKNKEKIMIAQSRHAAMGEMISMIAHQWRQPISVIAMEANNILADIELEMLDEKELKRGSIDILEQTQELSKTIDDFRNFFKPEQHIAAIFVKDVLKDAFGVMGKSLEHSKITMSTEICNEREIKTFSRELMQVFVNILKNAKEALIQNKIEDKQIHICIQDTQEGVSINITDNAGGVSEGALCKVFDAYYSTKGEKDGIGLGLYMSKTIVERHLDGTLCVSNSDKGACFEIKLPKTITNKTLKS